MNGTADWTWFESYTKLLAFGQTQYARVLVLDSDATLLQARKPFTHPQSPER